MKVRFKKGIIPLVFVMTFFGFEKELMWGYLASFMHECAHLLASILLKCEPLSITFGVCAMNLETKRVTNTDKHMKILTSGPLFSFIMFGALFCLRKLNILDVRIFEFANLCIGFANLFPATPLDGGRMLKLWLLSRFGIFCGIKIMKLITNIMISLILVVNALIIFFGAPNPFLMIFLSFLIFSLLREKNDDMVWKELVLSGQIPCVSKVKTLRFKSDCRLTDIATRISPSYYLAAFIFESGKFLGVITQHEILQALNSFNITITANEYINANKINAIEKSKDLLYNK